MDFDMDINFRPLSEHDISYVKVIDLYREAFPGAQHLPVWLLNYKLKRGKDGFNIIYSDDTWIGLVYTTSYKDIIFIQFLAISGELRSGGYGSQVIKAIKKLHSEKRIVLNIEEVNEQAANYQQRLKRKSFYETNGFVSSGFIVKEPGERQEMMIFGGDIIKAEVEDMYKHLFGNILGFLIRPKILNIF
jgi:ribosomal protein S18 acetylase RimI-like enzyme